MTTPCDVQVSPHLLPDTGLPPGISRSPCTPVSPTSPLRVLETITLWAYLRLRGGEVDGFRKRFEVRLSCAETA